MLYSVETTHTPEEIGIRLEAAARKRGFGVLITHDLQASMAKHGLVFGSPCRIYELCQPEQAKKVLEVHPAVSTVLPCRIAIYREHSRTMVSMVLPTALLSLFREPELLPVAQDVERDLIAILNEAAG